MFEINPNWRVFYSTLKDVVKLILRIVLKFHRGESKEVEHIKWTDKWGVRTFNIGKGRVYLRAWAIWNYRIWVCIAILVPARSIFDRCLYVSNGNEGILWPHIVWVRTFSGRRWCSVTQVFSFLFFVDKEHKPFGIYCWLEWYFFASSPTCDELCLG